jgi:2-polyprenyl-3-methyl-5-hydroxy-6-metoxy-1,4-benzoquinol methylase
MGVGMDVGMEIDERPDRRQLTEICRQIYAKGPPLKLQQKLTTVYRPLYGAVDRVLACIPRGSRLLDIGCGTGTLLYLASALKQLEAGYGFDTKRESIEVARRVEVEVPVHFTCAEEVPGEIVAGCNVIALVDLLHHVPAEQKGPLLDRVLRHAGPGALLIVKDVDSRPRWRAFANRITDFLSTRSFVHYISPTELRARLERGGFEIVHSDRWYNYVWCEYLVVGRKLGAQVGGTTSGTADAPVKV